MVLALWKLNISILEDPEYISLIRSFWSSWHDLKPSYHTLQNWWDVGKFKIKQITILFCSDRAKWKRSRCTELTAKAASLKREVDNGRVSVLDEYNSVLSELSSMDLEDARGAQVRSRARWCEEEESSSSFFFRLEKKRSKDNWISSVRLPDKSCVSELPDLMVAWSSFYKDLFTSVDTDPSVQSDLLDNLQSALSPQEADLCEGSLSVDEALVALKGMAKRKTPGSDGFPMEFYVQFWDILGEDLVNVLNRAYSAGVLTTSQRRGLISLLFKKGDCLERANWRPITLLNVDYKIASRSVAGRLLKVIHSIVSPNQTCGVPGRFIGENVRFVCDAILYANENDLPLAILSLDQEKAFDRVEWSFLLATLERMGFGPSFIQWVKTFYTGIQSAVIVNGYISEFFSLSRGVRQGCPLSPLLYVLIAEVLACNIRACPAIRGPTLPDLSACRYFSIC